MVGKEMDDPATGIRKPEFARHGANIGAAVTNA
jgi:hypothetical protein